jgi:predicted alpha/beta superfamily hydrolase
MSNQVIQAAEGRVVFEGKLYSPILQTNRFVRIYLPPSYDREPAKRFPVLYLHDGQNIFSTVGTNVAFGWGSWQLDKTVDELSAARKMREIIMVGVDCSAERYLDYRGPAHRQGKSELEEVKRRPLAPGDDSRYEGTRDF